MITKNAGVKLAPLLENKYKFIVKYITLVSSLYHLRNSADYQTKFTKFRINYFEKGCWNPELFEIFMEYRKNNDNNLANNKKLFNMFLSKFTFMIQIREEQFRLFLFMEFRCISLVRF